MNSEGVEFHMSPYGYPIARFPEPVPMTISRRVVIVDSIIWDAEYGYHRAIGHYAKKDGTAGHQIAKPLMGLGEVPAYIRDGLNKKEEK